MSQSRHSTGDGRKSTRRHLPKLGRSTKEIEAPWDRVQGTIKRMEDGDFVDMVVVPNDYELKLGEFGVVLWQHDDDCGHTMPKDTFVTSSMGIDPLDGCTCEPRQIRLVEVAKH